MIAVEAADEALRQETQSNRELYERLREYTGFTVLIRRIAVERVGVLQWVKFLRTGNSEDRRIVFGLGEETDFLNTLHHIEVKIDGVWKLLSSGSDRNREL